MVPVVLAVLGVVLAASALARRRLPPLVRIEERVIYGPQGFTYTMTATDLLWMARAIVGEAGGRVAGGAAVAWAMVQNHALRKTGSGRRPRFTTLTELLRRYCQPINPRWARGGDLAIQHGSTEDQLRRRERITNLSWSEIPMTVKVIVAALANGTLPNPVPGRTDWRSTESATAAQLRVGLDVDDNLFLPPAAGTAVLGEEVRRAA